MSASLSNDSHHGSLAEVPANEQPKREDDPINSKKRLIAPALMCFVLAATVIAAAVLAGDKPTISIRKVALSVNPTTNEPTPAVPSKAPTFRLPSSYPSTLPSYSPSFPPSTSPSVTPTIASLHNGSPSESESDDPAHNSPSLSAMPSLSPSSFPTQWPTKTSTRQPPKSPTLRPTKSPNPQPTGSPSPKPSFSPSISPSSSPSAPPTLRPTTSPSPKPSVSPSLSPSSEPSVSPSTSPSRSSSALPSHSPSGTPSNRPSICEEPLLSQDFEGTLDESWGSVVERGGTHFVLLSKGDSNTFKRTIDGISPSTTTISVDFHFYEIGSWNDRGEHRDYVRVTVGNTTIDLRPFSSSSSQDEDETIGYSGTVDGISWSRKAISETGNMGFGDGGPGHHYNQIHAISIQIPQEKVTNSILNFQIAISVSHSDEEGGIDDLVVTPLC